MLGKTFAIFVALGPNYTQWRTDWALIVCTHQTVTDILSGLETTGSTKLKDYTLSWVEEVISVKISQKDKIIRNKLTKLLISKTFMLCIVFN